VVSDSAGRIWISTNRGISVVDPARLNGDSLPVITHIQAISADGTPLTPGDTVQIPTGRKRLIIGYVGLNLSFPERVKFRYKLDGFDRDWAEPTTLREAVYTNLEPRSYRFHVKASDAAGIWDSPEATVGIQVDPAFWQTWWFRLSGGLALLLVAALMYRFRLNQISNQLKFRFEERLAERSRIAQELHDTLLQGFISASMQLHVLADAQPEDSSAKHSLQRTVRLVGHVIEEGRNALRGLRVPDAEPEDLEKAFARVPQDVGVEQEPKFRISVEGQSRALRSLLRDEIYRIGREALVNAFRHARAKNVDMELEYGSKFFRLLVRDDGCGMDQSILKAGREGHWGLRGMRERSERIGGTLHVWSRAMTGTEVAFSVPNHVAFGRAIGEPWAGRIRRLLTRKTLIGDNTSR
jgi:signal transduction histidine kinase